MPPHPSEYDNLAAAIESSPLSDEDKQIALGWASSPSTLDLVSTIYGIGGEKLTASAPAGAAASSGLIVPGDKAFAKPRAGEITYKGARYRVVGPDGPTLGAPAHKLADGRRVQPVDSSLDPLGEQKGLGQAQRERVEKPFGTPLWELSPDEYKARRKKQKSLDAEADAEYEAERYGTANEDTIAKLEAHIRTSAQLDDVPELEPLIDGWLYRGTLAQIYGPSGHYKTFIAADMAAAVCTGRQWFGHESKQGSVLHIVGEGVHGFRARVRAMEETRERGHLANLRVMDEPVQIGGPAWSAFVEIVQRRGYDMVIVDTQARSTVGRKENDNSDMGEVVAALDYLIGATGAAVLLVHHSGKGDADDGRGASAIKAALQTQIRVCARKGMTVEVKQTKQKDHPEIGPYFLQMEPFGDSLVVSADRVQNGMAPDRTEEKAKEERDLRTLLDITGLVADEVSVVVAKVLAATFSGGMGATKGEVKIACSEALRGIREINSSTYYTAWSKLEKSGHLLARKGTQKVLLSEAGCKAIGVPFECPGWVSEDEWEEAIEAGHVSGDPTDFDA